MKIKTTGDQIKLKHLVEHKTKHHVFIKFIFVLILFISYFLFIIGEYGIQDGFLVTLLTWSFFVLCTPIVDAGFLIDFPLRLITKLKMYVSEIFVWSISIFLNLYAFFLRPEVYSKTKILILFKHILGKPFPFWSIIIISALGTFVSVIFGDELLDNTKHKKRKIYHKHKHNYRFIIIFFLFGITLILYDFLLKQLGVNLPI